MFVFWIMPWYWDGIGSCNFLISTKSKLILHGNTEAHDDLVMQLIKASAVKAFNSFPILQLKQKKVCSFLPQVISHKYWDTADWVEQNVQKCVTF